MKAGMFPSGESSGFKSTKLVADLEDKHKYVLHSSVLSTYIKLGLNVKKVYMYGILFLVSKLVFITIVFQSSKF